MKTSILKTAILVGSLVFSANLFAFTAVVSGTWSSPTTWGGIGPGSTVTAQDIIIPAGIIVDMDTDVSFTGPTNTFTVNGTLISVLNHDLWIGAGSFAGNGSSTLRSFTMNSALATYTSTGTLSVGTFSNQGATIPAASNITVGDSLDLSSGTLMLNSGCNFDLAMNAKVRVDNGTIVLAGGAFNTVFPYSIWYVGGTKTMGIECNSLTVQDIHVALSSNTEDLVVTGNLVVGGTLDLAAGHLSMSGNTLTLMGDYTGGAGAQFETNGTSIEVIGAPGSLTRDLEFSVGSTVNALTINRNTAAVKLASALTVTGGVHLIDGTLRLMTGSTLTIGPGSLVEITDGYLSVTGGTFDGTASYNVAYIGGSHPSDVELTGTGLNNVTVDLLALGQSVTLTSDVKINGALNMVKGKLFISTHTLELAGTFNQGMNSWMMGDATSFLHLHMTSSVNDTLSFDPASGALSDLIIEIPALSTITMGSNLAIHTQVNFISGKLDVGTGDLTIANGAAINGYDDTKYVVTSDTGSLRCFVNVNASHLFYPIGTASGYTPASVQQVNTATAGYIRIRVMEGVFTNGTTGTDMSTTESLVNKTWLVSEGSNVTIDMNLRFYWRLTNEVNGFDRTNSFITHYSNNQWDVLPGDSALSGPNSTYYLTRTGLTSLSPFAVGDVFAPLTVPEQIATGFSLYPNPTLDFITVNTGDEHQTQYLYELYDASGKLVNSFSNSNPVNRIDLANYEDGYYLLRITNLQNQLVETKRIVKSGK